MFAFISSLFIPASGAEPPSKTALGYRKLAVDILNSAHLLRVFVRKSFPSVAMVIIPCHPACVDVKTKNKKTSKTLKSLALEFFFGLLRLNPLAQRAMFSF